MKREAEGEGTLQKMTHYRSVFNAISVTIEYSSFLKYREKSN